MLLTLLISFFFLNSNSLNTLLSADEKITIVVIDGKAFLADVDEDGRMVRKYMEINSYFDSDANFDGLVESAKEEYLKIRALEKDQIRFIQYDFLDGAVTGLAVKHLSDLTNHYNNSYANQIVVTLSKRQGNEVQITKMENLILDALHAFKVPNEDIKVRYKWDKGVSATEFIKVNTELRALAG